VQDTCPLCHTALHSFGEAGQAQPVAAEPAAAAEPEAPEAAQDYVR
jgi:hypothetical protein